MIHQLTIFKKYFSHSTLYGCKPLCKQRGRTNEINRTDEKWHCEIIFGRGHAFEFRPGVLGLEVITAWQCTRNTCRSHACHLIVFAGASWSSVPSKHKQRALSVSTGAMPSTATPVNASPAHPPWLSGNESPGHLSLSLFPSLLSHKGWKK